MKIEFTLRNEYDILEEDFINKPILKDDKPIGTIIKATKENENIKIEGLLFDKFIKAYLEVTMNNNGTFNCSGIELT